MIISVLSGKGGTGKTTFSTSLAASIENSFYIDCDVEEPNGYIFIKPDISEVLPVNVKTPQVDKELCDSCGACANACQFNAIAVVNKQVLIFPEICHHCGACKIACKKNAITEVERSIGVIEIDKEKLFMHGKLNVGEPISIPIINKLKGLIQKDKVNIIDCPPGASCSAVASIEDSDYCILVTEPTPFGLHDLNVAVTLVEKMNIPFGVVINKASNETNIIHEYCKSKNIDIVMEIPFSREFAEEYSKGNLLVDQDSNAKENFIKLYEKIERGLIK